MTNEHAETLRNLAMALAALEALVAENERLKAQRDLMVEDWHDEQRGLAADRRALAERVRKHIAHLAHDECIRGPGQVGFCLCEACARALSYRDIDLEPLLTPEGT